MVDPCLDDTDGDGLDDKEEREAGTNPRMTDTDGDGALDGRDIHPLSPSDTIYDRNAAYDYSQKYYENYNDDYPSMEHGDCENFVSQCLYAGGLEMNSYWYMREHHFYDRFGDLFSNKAQNWSYEWSLNWTIANDQCNYFKDTYAINVYKIEREDSISEFVKSHPNIQVGDLLYFHNADETKDVNHATIISVVTESEIKYAGHTGSRDQYPLSDAIKHKEDGEYSYDYVYIIQMSDAVWLKNRKFIILLVITVVTIGLIVLYNTRVVYWHNVYWEHERPNVTDAEYLEVYDLRFFLDNHNTNDIEKLDIELVNESLQNNGEVPIKYSEIISSDFFKEINPRGFLSKYKEDIIDEELIFEETDVIIRNDKAIFLYGYSYHASYKNEGEINNYGQGYEGYPNRIYLKLDSGKWIVQSVFTIV